MGQGSERLVLFCNLSFVRFLINNSIYVASSSCPTYVCPLCQIRRYSSCIPLSELPALPRVVHVVLPSTRSGLPYRIHFQGPVEERPPTLCKTRVHRITSLVSESSDLRTQGWGRGGRPMDWNTFSELGTARTIKVDILSFPSWQNVYPYKCALLTTFHDPNILF